MEQEDKSEISEQTSEFRKEALNSTDNIVEISKGLKEALDSQSASIDRAENEIAASSQAEETQAATITGISNSLSELLVVQKEILDSLTGLNKSIDTATQQQGDDAGGGDGDAGAAGGGGDARHAAFGGAITGANPFLALASYSGGGGGGGGGGYGFGGGATFDGTMGTGEGLTEEKNQAITDFAEKYNINPNALAGILNVESEFDTSSRGGAGNNYSGIFQLQSQQIAGLTESVFGDALTPEEYRNLSFEDQLKVYEQYMLNAVGDEGDMKDFFTGDAEQDTSRLWALQLAPGNAKNIDYSNPNALISNTRQAGIISAPGGGVTVGSAVGSLSMGGLLETENAMLTPLSLNWVGEELPEGITEGSNEITLTDPDSGEEFSVNFEVENIDGNLTTVGPVTLAQDTDLEGISGAAGDPVEVSAEMAQDLADQIGATLEPTDPETPATPEELGADNNIPETMATAVGLENPVMDNPPTEGTAAGSQAPQTQIAAADYGEDKTTPVSFTGGKWNKQVNDYFGVA
jgi:hypothetical protein